MALSSARGGAKPFGEKLLNALVPLFAMTANPIPPVNATPPTTAPATPTLLGPVLSASVHTVEPLADVFPSTQSVHRPWPT